MKTNLIARPKLRGNRQIDRDHVRDFRITADGLAITEQENRLSIWGNLQRPGRDRFGKKIGRMRMRSSGGPSSRAPIRSESGVTVNDRHDQRGVRVAQ